VTALDGHQGLARWEAESPDMVLLDANLPKLNGFEVCRRIRQDAQLPIIMLTARDQDEDVVRGLQLGADDYVSKPFSVKQLRARMQAVLRRYKAHGYFQPGSRREVGDLALDLQSYEVRKAGALIRLTPLEFRILYMLAMNDGRVIPHARLVEYAWGFDGGETSLLKTHICHIRQKLDLPADGTKGIQAVAGVGYTLGYG
jgi:DNA-binding response OmpR family regulator